MVFLVVKWVPVNTVLRVLRLWMEERPPIWRVLQIYCVVCITDGTKKREVMVSLQSCTVSLPVLRHSCSESSVTCIDAYDVISVKREEDSDIDCQEEGIPIAISFPAIKCEQDEVSYTGWGTKISHFSTRHCASCSGGREVGVVSCGWLASTIVSTHNGLDR